MSRGVEVKSIDKSFKKFHPEGKGGLWMYLQRDVGLREGLFLRWERPANT